MEASDVKVLEKTPASQKLQADDAENLLKIDIQSKRESLSRSLRKSHGINLNQLSNREQDMLLDFEFNVGSAVRKFPKFTTAVVAGDEATQQQEFTRSFTDAQGNERPLARNRAFYNSFLSPDAKKAFGE